MINKILGSRHHIMHSRQEVGNTITPRIFITKEPKKIHENYSRKEGERVIIRKF